MDFSGDSLYLLEYPDYATFDLHLMGKPLKCKQNDWNDISLVFNVSTNRIILKLNGVQVLNAFGAAQASYEFLEFYATGIVSAFGIQSEFYIDDIVYRRIPNITQPHESSKSILNASVSPNPANERLVISPDSNTRDAWQVQLRNSFGQIVSTHTGVGSSPLEIAVSDFASGIYISAVFSISISLFNNF